MGPSAEHGKWARPVGITVAVDVGLHDLSRRSSFACAKKRAGRLQNVVGPVQFLDLALKFLDALRVRCSGAKALSTVDISLLGPIVQGLWHAANLGAIDSIAAHSEGWSARCSCTMRKVRSRTSGENLVDLFMAPSSRRLEPPLIQRGSEGNFEYLLNMLQLMPHLQNT